ncbi:MAG: molybdenum cofactor guanylyltransferase [Ginsengibacter sp.]
MLGVILCGGQSSRMGADKGLLKLPADTWAQTAVDKMMTLQLPVVLSVNSNQYNEYSIVFPSGQLIKDNETLEVRGPLCGVLSVHLQNPLEDLFVLACDMPLMEAGMLKELFSIYKQEPSNDAFVFTNDGEPEPLCAIYTAKGISYIAQLQKENQLTKHSMKFMLEHVNTFSVPLNEEQKKYFQNFNAHAELNGL